MTGMDLGIAGETALVLGGTKGLGWSCVRALHAAGVRVAVNGRNAAEGAAAVASLGEGAVFVQGDVGEADQRARLLREASEALGDIRILVTNAGGPPTGLFGDHNIDVWRRAFEVSVLAAIAATQAVLPGMIAAGYGRIVNITSFVVKEPYPNMAISNAARVGLTGAMATLAREVAGKGVTVNNILPGLMATGALDRVIRGRALRDNIAEADAAAAMTTAIPAGRFGTADDFGPLCAFLCSRHAGYITAQNIAVDGGLVRGLL